MNTDNRKGPIQAVISEPGTAPAVATNQTIRELLEIEQNQVVYNGFTRRQLTEAFNRVENKENWKLPIDAVVTVNFAELNAIKAAVIFFTGGAAKSKRRLAGVYHITAPGYYNSVGA